ncbi:MAG: dihydrofolate reductase, partial [Aeromicrobium sp.]|nr:dihydrofolate reductase [Aeromicrobium sp.]
TMTSAVKGSTDPIRLVVRRIAEELQKDTEVMSVLRRVGALPGNDVLVSQGHDGVVVARQGETAEIDTEAAAHVFVSS